MRAALADWLASDAETDTAVLIVSELVTNAVTHTDSTLIRVVATLLDDVVNLVVAAEQAHEGEIRADVAADGADHGRGLLIVETTADRWGVRPIKGVGCALAVWAECQLTAAPAGTTC
ncbi:ATP-binding protein [Streptomyces sp. H10-C2]|nr:MULTISPECIES: ATP-binding protein [unclassified Streptomyces]MDJ0347356.1 ATP-binding protein [Streptomyces sp. PH10-H1]MDJ0375566.1 ATP-binding protein [Streptomyces sp. H10-C2]